MDKRDKPPIQLVAKDGQPVSSPHRRPAVQKRVRRSTEPKQGRVGKSHRWEPTRSELKLMGVALAAGMTHQQVANIMGVGLRTLQTRCKKELAQGSAGVNAKVAGKLFEKCMKGDTIALIFWCKTRLGWNEKQALELTGKDGGPIQTEQVKAEADRFTQRIASMAGRFAATMTATPDAEPPANDGEAAAETA